MPDTLDDKISAFAAFEATPALGLYMQRAIPLLPAAA